MCFDVCVCVCVCLSEGNHPLTTITVVNISIIAKVSWYYFVILPAFYEHSLIPTQQPLLSVAID